MVDVPDDGGPIVRIYLPAGKFVIFASGDFQNPGAEEALVECAIANPNHGESTWRQATLGPAISGPYDAATIAVHAIVIPDAAEYHHLNCRDNGGSVRVASLPFPDISAIEVDTVLGGFKPWPEEALPGS